MSFELLLAIRQAPPPLFPLHRSTRDTGGWWGIHNKYSVWPFGASPGFREPVEHGGQAEPKAKSSEYRAQPGLETSLVCREVRAENEPERK